MCDSKNYAKTKIDQLIAAMDRLIETLDAARNAIPDEQVSRENPKPDTAAVCRVCQA